MIVKKDSLSIKRQAKLLGISESSCNYKPKEETPFNIKIMNRMDKLHVKYPAWGSRQLRDRLRLEGNKVNRKRIQRLMR